MISTIFYDSNGKVSSKRICGLGAFLVSSYIMVYLLHADKMDAGFFSIYTGAFALSMAAGVFEGRDK